MAKDPKDKGELRDPSKRRTFRLLGRGAAAVAAAVVVPSVPITVAPDEAAAGATRLPAPAAPPVPASPSVLSMVNDFSAARRGIETLYYANGALAPYSDAYRVAYRAGQWDKVAEVVEAAHKKIAIQLKPFYVSLERIVADIATEPLTELKKDMMTVKRLEAERSGPV